MTLHQAPTLGQVERGRRFPEDQEPPDLLDAAFAYTVEQEHHADGEMEGSPAWYGWALRKAFIEGARWERRKRLERCRKKAR